MKRIIIFLVLMIEMCMGFAQQPIKELENKGLIDVSLNRSEDLNSSFQDDPSVPVLWGIAATGPSLHLGSLTSLNILKTYQAAGHPVIIWIDTGTAGFDPAGSLGN